MDTLLISFFILLFYGAIFPIEMFRISRDLSIYLDERGVLFDADDFNRLVFSSLAPFKGVKFSKSWNREKLLALATKTHDRLLYDALH